jgi:4-amino-4-deoxy-L-arabinose transferase-like glycosyltransferase
MSGIGFRLGLGPELAPRLPVALISVAFLIFFWWILDREFGCRAAWIATLILGTSGMWVGFSEAAVPDIPMTACYSAAMLLALPWISTRDRRWLPAASALFGLAVLAKGIGPLAIAAPLVLGRHVTDWLRPRVLAPFFAIALPWYALCYWRNGWTFLHDFFVVHTFGRLASASLGHGQPFWYYLPVLLAALLPWTPLLGLITRRDAHRDPRRRFLLTWFLFTLVFFSAFWNKLPGYILPALPAFAALAGILLDEAVHARAWLAVCAAMLMALPIAAQMLPAAMSSGLSHAPRPAFRIVWLAAFAVAAVAWALEARGRRLASVLAVAVGAGLGIAWLKASTAAELDRSVSARGLWRQIESRASDVCLGELNRTWVYGLNYYAGRALPDCDDAPRAIEISVDPRNPNVVPSPFRN